MRGARDEAYIVYCAVFVAVFVYLFSALGNFGINPLDTLINRNRFGCLDRGGACRIRPRLQI